MPSLDPQVLSSLISAAGGVVAGAMGGNWWGKKQSTHSPHADRCDKICSLLVNSFDKLLTALEVAGEPPAVKVAIRDARDSIVTAKNYLGISGSEIHLDQ
jgi:hypothetical protein